MILKLDREVENAEMFLACIHAFKKICIFAR